MTSLPPAKIDSDSSPIMDYSTVNRNVSIMYQCGQQTGSFGTRCKNTRGRYVCRAALSSCNVPPTLFELDIEGFIVIGLIEAYEDLGQFSPGFVGVYVEVLVKLFFTCHNVVPA